MTSDSSGKNSSLFPLNRGLLYLTNILIVPLLAVLYFIGLNNFTLAYFFSFVIVADMFFLSLIREIELTRRQTGREIARLEKRAQGLNILAHQLKAPLSEAKSYIRILNEGPGLDRPQQNYLAGLTREVERLNLLVREISDWLAIEAGRWQLKKKVVQAEEVIAEAIKRQAPLAKAKEVAIAWAPPERPPMILADQEKLQEAIEYLLDNAIKASPPDSQVTVSLKNDDDWLEIDLADQGPGIPAGERKKIFEPFYQIPGRADWTAGLGLGLTLTREVARHHNGQLTLHCEPGPGCTFSLKLPLHSN